MIYFLKLFFFNATPPDATTKKKNSFKDRGTVARTKHTKNHQNVHWLYKVKTFRAFGCQTTAFDG